MVGDGGVRPRGAARGKKKETRGGRWLRPGAEAASPARPSPAVPAAAAPGRAARRPRPWEGSAAVALLPRAGPASQPAGDPTGKGLACGVCLCRTGRCSGAELLILPEDALACSPPGGVCPVAPPDVAGSWRRCLTSLLGLKLRGARVWCGDSVVAGLTLSEKASNNYLL